MIEKLTKAGCIEHEFTPEQIERLFTWDNHEPTIGNNKGFFFATNIEGKIYSGIDAVRKVCFINTDDPFFPSRDLSLIPEYYKLIETAYLKKQKTIAGDIFNEPKNKERFRKQEIKKVKKLILDEIEESKVRKYQPQHVENYISKLNHYVTWLKDKDNFTNSNNKQPVRKVKSEEAVFEPQLFRDLFIKPEIITECLNLLKETDKPCINGNDEFIRNKGAFIVWFEALQSKAAFNFHFKNDVERAATLNHNFPKLNISESLFRQPNKRAKDSYQNHFVSEITTIKH